MKPNRTKRRSRLMLAALLLCAVLLLAGCGGYYYRATIQGFVIDDETGAGINEATVRVYTSEVEDATALDYINETATVVQGGNGGYYSSTVIWSNLFGAYGQEGDTTTIWIAVTHPDYASTVVQAQGVLSDDDNLIASVRLTQTTFDRPALRGRVVDSTGSGVDGVRVVLDLPVVSGTDDAEDSVTQTATIDGQSGTFEFSPVEWSDENTADTDGEVTAIVRIDDPDWGADVSAIGSPTPEDFLIDTSVTLIPGEQVRVIPADIEVYRRPRTEFTTTVTGRLVERINPGAGAPIEDRPVQGVTVTLTYNEGAGAGTLAETINDQTDANGTYVFVVTWTDAEPGDFDNADETSGSPDPSIAAGEDGLLVDIAYTDVAVPGGTLAFTGANLTDHQIVSNPRGGQNRLPDVIESP